MRNYLEFLNETLNEEIVSMIVYHRTPSERGVRDIIDGNFSIGGFRGSVYGKGFYFNWDYSSVVSDYSRQNYGEYVIKAIIDLRGFFILPEEIQKKVYSRTFEKIGDQLDFLVESKYIKPFTGYEQFKELKINNGARTSIYATAYVPELQSIGLKGLLYDRGENSDGKALVLWDYKVGFKPLGWAYIPKEIPEHEVEWEDVDVITKIHNKNPDRKIKNGAYNVL